MADTPVGLQYGAPTAQEGDFIRRLGVACFLALSASWLVSCAEASRPGVTSATSTLYARTDTNATTVWSPRVRVAGAVGDALTVESTYGLDAWTGASIDVVTAATKAIHEVRHEVGGGVAYDFGDVSASGAYRYSTEPDYTSHGAVGHLSLDLAQNNTTLDLSGFGGRDTVGRAGDPLFSELQRSFGGRFSLTQLLDRQTLLQLSWETTRVLGYQASPYRYVALGGSGTCASLAPFCLSETVPDARTRQALVARVRRALGSIASLGLVYRYYFDDWGIQSQTISPDVALLIGDHGTLSFSYRYYTQSQADFYQPRYLDPNPQHGYLTRDRELSALYAHRLGASYQHELPVGKQTILSLALRAGGTYYRYLAFVGLTHVEALELTGLLGLRFE